MAPLNAVYLVDLSTLKAKAFSTPSSTIAINLKSVLESSGIKNLFFDCRGDSDKLFGLYNVKITSVLDLQLIKLATNKSGRDTVKALDMTIGRRRMLTEADRADWDYAKTWSEKAMKFGPEEIERRIVLSEGHYYHLEASLLPTQQKEAGKQIPTSAGRERAVGFQYANQRRLSQLIKQYCIRDVIMLQMLYRRFLEHELWSEEWAERVEKETEARLELSCSPDFDRKDTVINGSPDGWKDLKWVKKTVLH